MHSYSCAIRLFLPRRLFPLALANPLISLVDRPLSPAARLTLQFRPRTAPASAAVRLRRRPRRQGIVLPAPLPENHRAAAHRPAYWTAPVPARRHMLLGAATTCCWPRAPALPPALMCYCRWRRGCWPSSNLRGANASAVLILLPAVAALILPRSGASFGVGVSRRHGRGADGARVPKPPGRFRMAPLRSTFP